MKRILSLDWDYFVNATAAQRYTLFPDGGNENISYELQDFIWNSRYACSPELREIGVLKDDYKIMFDIFKRFSNKYVNSIVANPNREVLITVSHRWCYEFTLQRTDKDEEFELYNVDFHHDMYHYKTGSEEVNCGNWVNCLFEQRPNMKYSWIKREDSDENTIGGEKAPCNICTLKELEGLDFDYIFICRSDCWSPPHLDNLFETLWTSIRRYMPVEVENKVVNCRKVDTPSELEQKYGFETALAKSMRKYPNATCVSCGAILPEGSPSYFCPACNSKVD